MKYAFLTISLVFVISATGFAQKSVQSKTGASSEQKVTASKGLDIQSGTQIAAQLQSTLDVKKANVGDEVVLKATKSVKQNGHVAIEKGAKLFGRVTEVQQKAKGSAGSRIGVLFDRIQNSGGGIMPITATIMSITQVRSSAAYGDDGQTDVFASSSSQTFASSSGSSSGGGLLGGVGNTVGGVANTAIQTTGNVVNATTQTAGTTVGSATGALKGLSISQSTNASAHGGSTLSLAGGNLKLEKGTTFNLAVSQSASVENN